MAMHGDKQQAERDWVLKEFKEGRSPILVATDVASRGLDVKDIQVCLPFCILSGTVLRLPLMWLVHRPS
jgi:ATP-dependent RNA helicase DDX5/DBP2